MINVKRDIERLLIFAQNNNLILPLDIIPSRNALMDLLNVEEPFEGEVDKEECLSVTEILSNILDYAFDKEILEDNTTTQRDLLDAKIMGLLMPRQSEVNRNFYDTAKNIGIQKATDDFYNLSKASNYIRMDRIKKNIYWLGNTTYGDLEITINLSKPEKDPKDIAASKLKPQSNYPKCLLCIENVGYAGHINHPARQNHRVIPVTVANEQWYFQYSPYVYYNEHCILFKGQHVPMRITEKTFNRLFDFVEKFPHYFIGSNADLPIVGGSILSHEHFQGGRHTFPMEKAPVEAMFKHKKFNGIKAGIVKWPMSVIRLTGDNKEELIELSIEILNNWRNYSDKDRNILSETKEKDEIIPHNTITPIVRRTQEGEFQIDLVLRNNRTTDEYPDGIFHPHKELHHIKKENIGLIEVMGLAVLPARLKDELSIIKDYLSSNKVFKPENIQESDPMYKHLEWTKELILKYGISCTEEEGEEIVKREVSLKFLNVLMDAGVYKRDEEGHKGFCKFMNFAGFLKL